MGLKKRKLIGKVKEGTVKIKSKPGKPVVVKKPHKRESEEERFSKFFDDEWQQTIKKVRIPFPGWEGASWDRKAAYLLWEERKRNPW